MPKIVGLTGGIGSGKSTVAAMFSELEVPVYIADSEAKKLMNENSVIKEKIINLLGVKSYQNGILDRTYVAELVFNNKELLTKLNEIVHPAVADHFENWARTQKSNYVIKEAAILFENGGYKNCDYIILVTAPEETRINRVVKRDGTTRDKVLKRMQYQWKDSRKKKLADFVVNNEKLEETFAEVNKIHNKLRVL